MAIVKHSSGGKGSLNDIQLLVNKNKALIDHLISVEFPELSKENIEWKSPLKKNYEEYRDDDFIKLVGLNPAKINLNKFWPVRGPQWDALAATAEGSIILVEAKANIPEVVSPATSAGPKSKVLIDKSLNDTKAHLGITNDVDWSGKFYQYTNRLAHLYFLRVKCKVPTYLVNIYFVGDKTVNGPETIQEWQAALQVMHAYLGVSTHRLSKYIADIFIDVCALKK